MAASRIRIAASSLRLHLSMLMLFRHRVTSPAGVEEQLRDRLVFASPRSPYRPLLETAGYDWPSVRQLVMTRGLDVALDQLCADGVYVRIQEFKGMEPAVRQGRTFNFQERDFPNPLVRAALRVRSRGSP